MLSVKSEASEPGFGMFVTFEPDMLVRVGLCFWVLHGVIRKVKTSSYLA